MNRSPQAVVSVDAKVIKGESPVELNSVIKVILVV